MDIIIYPYKDGLARVIPTPECGLPIEEVALKDVPAGTPFLIVEESDLPDMIFREAWIADFSNPHGRGADWGVGSDNAVLGYTEQGHAAVFATCSGVVNTLRSTESIWTENDAIEMKRKSSFTKPEIELDSAKEIVHKKRRIVRSIELAPYDKTISLQIPGNDTVSAEKQRVEIRERNAKIQKEIDESQTPDQLKQIMERL